jgi:hypothetical protein
MHKGAAAILFILPIEFSIGMWYTIIRKRGMIIMTLNLREKEVVEKIVNEMTKNGLFSGQYDAKNDGSRQLMYGISMAMEYLAYLVSDEYGAKISNTFMENMIKSEKKS